METGKAQVFARANNSDLLRSLKHLLETRHKTQMHLSSKICQLLLSLYNVKSQIFKQSSQVHVVNLGSGSVLSSFVEVHDVYYESSSSYCITHLVHLKIDMKWLKSYQEIFFCTEYSLLHAILVVLYTNKKD